MPQHVAFGGIKAIQHARAAKRIGAAFVNEHRCSRAGRVADAIVGALVLIVPKGFPVSGIETMHAFDLRGFHESIGDINSAIRHSRPTIAWPNFSAPLDWQLRRRKLFHDSRFPPYPIALRPAPLRPVISKSKFGG